MKRSAVCVALFFVVVSRVRVDAQEVVLKSPDRGLEVKLAPVPGGTATYPNFIVSWEHLASGPETGALVFFREGSRLHEYVAVGKVAPFALADSGEQTLVGGTATPIYTLAFTHSTDTLEMRVDASQRPKVEQLLATYEAGQGLVHAGGSKGDVQSALDAATAAFVAACGTKPKLDVKWADFSGERTRLASVLGSVVRGIADKCTTTSYKAAIAKLSTFRLRFDAATPDQLKLQHTGNVIEVTTASGVVNPRQRATAWITSDL